MPHLTFQDTPIIQSLMKVVAVVVSPRSRITVVTVQSPVAAAKVCVLLI